MFPNESFFLLHDYNWTIQNTKEIEIYIYIREINISFCKKIDIGADCNSFLDSYWTGKAQKFILLGGNSRMDWSLDHFDQ